MKEHLLIYLRGGQVIDIQVTDWTVKKSLTGEVNSLSWTMADDAKLPYIALADISAVIATGKP